jgi:hypothetical protein
VSFNGRSSLIGLSDASSERIVVLILSLLQIRRRYRFKNVSLIDATWRMDSLEVLLGLWVVGFSVILEAISRDPLCIVLIHLAIY